VAVVSGNGDNSCNNSRNSCAGNPVADDRVSGINKAKTVEKSENGGHCFKDNATADQMVTTSLIEKFPEK
jgi:hypothetical protein